MDCLTQQLIAITKRLRTAFDSLREHVERISSSIDRAAADYHAEKRQTVDGQPVLVEVRRSQSEIDEERAREASKEQREARQEGRDRVRLRFELGGLVIGSILALASVCSLIVSLISANAARDAARAAQSQTQATKASIDATVRQFQLDQRAWISLQGSHIPPPTEEEIKIKLDFLNSGKTPAADIVEADFIYVWPKPVLKGPPADVSKHFVFMPMAPIAPQQTGTINGTEPMAKIGAAWGAVKRGDNILYEIGEIHYNDAFGHPHRTTFCLYQAKPTDQLLTYCERGNSID